MGQVLPLALRSIIDMECLEIVLTEYNIAGTKDKKLLLKELNALLKKRATTAKQPNTADIVFISPLIRTLGHGKNINRRRRFRHS